jgi:hypothetical protein
MVDFLHGVPSPQTFNDSHTYLESYLRKWDVLENLAYFHFMEDTHQACICDERLVVDVFEGVPPTLELTL